jgi:hypothetical protein
VIGLYGINISYDGIGISSKKKIDYNEALSNAPGYPSPQMTPR